MESRSLGLFSDIIDTTSSIISDKTFTNVDKSFRFPYKAYITDLVNIRFFLSGRSQSGQLFICFCIYCLNLSNLKLFKFSYLKSLTGNQWLINQTTDGLFWETLLKYSLVWQILQRGLYRSLWWQYWGIFIPVVHRWYCIFHNWCQLLVRCIF